MHFLFFIFFLLTSLSLHSKEILNPFYEEVSPWMKNQVQKDISIIPPFSRDELERFFDERATDLSLVKFTIENNQIFYEEKLPPHFKILMGRLIVIKDALQSICNKMKMPNTIFLVSLLDGLSHDNESLVEDVPIFVMSKLSNSNKPLILFPDFDALRGHYRAISNQDITRQIYSWSNKIPKLIWRGSTAQCSLDGSHMSIHEDNMDQFSRITLCKLSKQYPEIIDAGFTMFYQGGENIPYLQTLRSTWVPYEEQFNFKYYIQIDGNTSAYTHSGWKFFIGSLVFRPNSPWIQWYFGALKPLVHYVPVKKNLENLIDRINWAKKNDKKAEEIAKRGQEFARKEIVINKNLLYLYYTIKQHNNLLK